MDWCDPYCLQSSDQMRRWSSSGYARYFLVARKIKNNLPMMAVTRCGGFLAEGSLIIPISRYSIHNVSSYSAMRTYLDSGSATIMRHARVKYVLPYKGVVYCTNCDLSRETTVNAIS